MVNTKERKYGGFNTLGHFLSAVKSSMLDKPKVKDGRITELQEKALTLDVDSAGGVLVPEEFVGEIMAHAVEESVVLAKAQIFPMQRDKISMPRLVDSDRSSNMFGGITFSWLEENANRATNEASPAIGELQLEAKSGVASAWVSNALAADAYNFEEFFRFAFGKAVSFYVDAHAFNGTGNAQPLGIIPSGAHISEDRADSSKVDIADLKELGKRFSPSGWKNGNLFVNQSVLPQLFEMQADAADSASMLNLADRKFFGIPITVTEYCPALGTKGDVILADFSQYVIGKRSLIISASDQNSTGFFTNKSLWKIEIRVDGQPAVDAAYTPYKGGSTISPFVVLN